MATPYKLVELGTVVSTQEEARRAWAGKPVLVTARHQTSGRGRMGAAWVNAARAVAASLAFETDWPLRRRGLIPLVAGLAARQALGNPVRLKWPNDLVVGELKVGGILVEATGGLVVAGVGVNLWWPDPIEGAGSLLGADPGPEAADWIADHWASALLERLAAGPDRWGRAEYLEACVTLGVRVLAGEAGPGVAADVGDDGSLLVATDEGSVVAVSESVGAAPLQD